MRPHFQNAKWSGGATGFRALSGLANSLIAVRMVGVDIYGHLAAVLSVFVLYLSLNTSLYTMLVARLMSPAVVHDPGIRSEILASIAMVTGCSLVLLSFLAAILFWSAPNFLGFDKYPDMKLAYFIMGALVSVQVLSLLQSSIIESAGRLDLAMKAQLFGPFVLLLILGVSYLSHVALSLPGYVIMLFASACIDLAMLWMVRRMVMGLAIIRTGTSPSIARSKELIRSGIVLQGTSLMNLFLEPLNKVLLSYFIGPVAVTTYDLTMKVIWGIHGLFGSAMRIFLHFGDQDGASLGRSYIRVISLIAVPALIMHTVGAILLSWIAHRWVNIDASHLMLFFAIATLSNLGMIFITPLYTSLIGRNDLGFIFRCQAILALSNICISIAAIPFFGVVGAAMGLLVATAYNCVAVYLRHCSQLGRVRGIAGMLKEVALRFIVAGTLFSVTLYCGAQSELGNLWLVILIVGSVGLGIAEPLPRRLLAMTVK